jgi:hypothetical protein
MQKAFPLLGSVGGDDSASEWDDVVSECQQKLPSYSLPTWQRKSPALIQCEKLCATLHQSGKHLCIMNESSLNLNFIPTITIDNIGLISFPISTPQIEKIQSEYPINPQTRIIQIFQPHIQTPPRFNLVIDQLVREVKCSLGYSNNVEIIAKLEQLIVYYPGTHEIHYDPPSEGVIGTLLLQLPSLYQGQTKVLCEKCCYSECLQGGLASGEEFLYTAFRKDCKEISSDILLGNRVVLRYVLIQPLSQASFGNVPPSCDIQDLKLSFKKAIGELGSSFVAIGYQSETEPLANRFIDFVKSCRDDFGDPLCDIALGSIGYNSEYNRSQSGSLLRLIQPCSLHIDIWNNFPVGDPVTVLGNYSDKNSSMVVIWNSSNRIEVLEKLYLSGLVPKLFEALVVSSNSSLDVLVKLFHQISSKLQGTFFFHHLGNINDT